MYTQMWYLESVLNSAVSSFQGLYNVVFGTEKCVLIEGVLFVNGVLFIDGVLIEGMLSCLTGQDT